MHTAATNGSGMTTNDKKQLLMLMSWPTTGRSDKSNRRQGPDRALHVAIPVPYFGRREQNPTRTRRCLSQFVKQRDHMVVEAKGVSRRSHLHSPITMGRQRILPVDNPFGCGHPYKDTRPAEFVPGASLCMRDHCCKRGSAKSLRALQPDT